MKILLNIKIKIPPPAPARGYIPPWYRRGRGVSERQWRSAANRSPLPLRSVLDAPHRGAGPEPAGEEGLGFANLSRVRGEKGELQIPSGGRLRHNRLWFSP